jgi:hypothetical protein
LRKVEKTEKNQHWDSIVDGDPKIDTSRFGVKAMSLDVNDPDGMKRAIRDFKKTVRKQQPVRT